MATGKTSCALANPPPRPEQRRQDAFAFPAEIAYGCPPMNTASVAPVAASGLPPGNAPASIGFKEWSVVCDALGSGRQSIILRKGGIAEGRDGFRFKHERFVLFPTQYHQQYEKVRSEERHGQAAQAGSPQETVAIHYLVTLDFACWVDRWETLMVLKPFHIWRDDVVRERFEYEDQRGLQCAFARVYLADRPWTFPNRPAYGGCRSWVMLPSSTVDLGWSPVLNENEHNRRKQEVRRILGTE